ncbi:MAG: hypothetical protein IT529_11265 [Burkholderiales bacterium]|nr:hypothetical protein [Burkholderiales bacterium]
MRLRRVPGIAVVALFAALAAATGVAAEEGARPVPGVDATRLTPDRYTVLGRLWVQTWQSAFDVPRHGEAGAAIAELGVEARRLGADAITNVACFNDQGGPVNRGWFCHALAVKLK